MGDLSHDFSSYEMACQCSDDCEYKDGSLIDEELVGDLQIVRERYGKIMEINSGLRCPAHNKAVGGKPDSGHVKKLAVDIKCVNSRDRWELVEALKTMFTRIGVHKEFIHVDIDDSKSQDVMWVY